jgi:hypothetical protein
MKIDMSRGDDTSRGEIETAITRMIWWISKKNTGARTRTEFVWCSSSEVGKAKATKHPEMSKVRWGAKQNLIWGKLAS